MLIHVNTGNQVEISINDVLDALYDYAWIHFTEGEELFMNNEYLSDCIGFIFPLALTR